MSRVFDLCAIDAGQTNIRYVVLDQGKELLRADTGEGIINFFLPGAEERLQRNLAAINICCVDKLGSTRFRVVSAGVTGISPERGEYAVAQKWFSLQFPESKVILHNDIYTTHVGNFAGSEGIILHAGTGSFAFGIDRFHRNLHTGGWGYLLGDEGAGFWIGLSGIKAAIKAYENTGPATLLKEDLLPFLGIESFVQVKSVVYHKDFSRKTIADFAPCVFARAEKGDPVARHILDAGAHAMTALLTPIVASLEFTAPCVYTTGGIYVHYEQYFLQTKSYIAERFGESITVEQGRKNTLDGAVWVGMQSLQTGR
jgi:N-acetylglucosamine kinase-like BadF-type ATPase